MFFAPIVATAAFAAAPFQPTAEQEAMYRAFSARDPAPACEQVESLSQHPVSDLRVIVVQAKQPAWVGMRAAECLATRHAEEARDDLLGWVGSEDSRGFALLVLNKLDDMPQPVAIDVAKAALAGPLADDARPRIRKVQDERVRALAEQGVGEE